jgi:hypothetical protein
MIDIKGSSLFETKDDSPIASDGHAPETRQIIRERMQPPARIDRHVAGLSDPVQDRQDATDLGRNVGWNATPVTVLPQPPGAFVPKARGGHASCKLSSDACQHGVT